VDNQDRRRDDSQITRTLMILAFPGSSSRHNPPSEIFTPDTNFHTESVAAAANLRAAADGTGTEGTLEIRRIARRMIPTVKTTPAMICGFVCFEMRKIHSVPKRLDQFRTEFVNFAISMSSLRGRVPCKLAQFDILAATFSPLWDPEEIKCKPTVEQFVDSIMTQWRVHAIALVLAGQQTDAAFGEALEDEANPVDADISNCREDERTPAGGGD
jgi:hypothetical protein